MKTKKEETKKEGNSLPRKKILTGVVVSTKMQKTLVVLVKRFVKHPKYDKYQTISKKYKADNRIGEYQIGDKVRIEECNPISKEKRFKVIKA